MLTEPVVESCSWIDAMAPWTCRDDGHGSCGWYHGTWQYLRILDLVSNPTWHSGFFIERLRADLGDRPAVDVMVSGCADYSMFAHVWHALGTRARCTLVDWCPTPLVASAWYARRVVAPEPVLCCVDATAHDPTDRYDAIVSDAFLPRFAAQELSTLLRAWRTSLRPGGVVLTTVRIHDGTVAPATSRETTIERWRRSALEAATWWPTISAVPVEQLAERVAEFARRQERNAFYQIDDLQKLLADAGFGEVDCKVVEVAEKRFAWLTAS